MVLPFSLSKPQRISAFQDTFCGLPISFRQSQQKQSIITRQFHLNILLFCAGQEIQSHESLHFFIPIFVNLHRRLR